MNYPFAGPVEVRPVFLGAVVEVVRVMPDGDATWIEPLTVPLPTAEAHYIAQAINSHGSPAAPEFVWVVAGPAGGLSIHLTSPHGFPNTHGWVKQKLGRRQVGDYVYYEVVTLSVLRDIARACERASKPLGGSSAATPNEPDEPSYRAGFIDGATAWAHWRDGKQEVGTTGKTLREAVEQIKRGDVYNYLPRRVEPVGRAPLPTEEAP